MKKCSRCKEEKPLTEFSPTSKNKVTGKQYYASHCKPCRVEYNRDKSGAKKRKFTKVTDTHKECTQCNSMLPLSEFSPSVRGSGGVAAYCKKCTADKYRDKEKAREATARYRSRHPERWRAAHRIHQFNRKNLIKATCDGTVTDEVLKELLNKTHCCWCKEEVDASDRTIEHIKELSQGGAHSKDNLDMACFSCNSSRNSRNDKN